MTAPHHPHDEHQSPSLVPHKMRSLGYDLVFAVPATVDEYNRLAKNTDACRVDAINNTLYRDTLNTWRAAFTEALEAATGIERNTAEVKNADGTTKMRVPKGSPEGTTAEPVLEYTENEKIYEARVISTLVAKSNGSLTEEAVKASFSTLALEIAAKCVFDPSATERKDSAPRKTPKFAYETADSLLAAVAEGKTTIERVTSNLAAKTGTPVSPDRESIAKAVHAIVLARQREQASKLTGEFVS